MKNLLKIAMLALCLTAAFLAARAFLHSAPSPALAPKTSAKGFAVVELFTSEGCSSCPPADRLVARIQQEDKDQQVYILVFHVDYWDRLGWKDTYSDHRYTERQSRYASWLHLQSIYTPEIIVNGRNEFVGSQEKTLRNAILSGLDQAPSAQLSISDIHADQGKVSWHYMVQHAAGNSSLVVALVQRAATTAVKAGENSGRILSHVQIVRDFITTSIGAGAPGSGSIQLPPALHDSDEELVAFVQNDDNGEIVAATRSPLR